MKTFSPLILLFICLNSCGSSSDPDSVPATYTLERPTWDMENSVITTRDAVITLEVTLTSSNDEGNEGIQIVFEVVSGRGLVNGQTSHTAITQAGGTATVSWSLGKEAGAQEVSASIGGQESIQAAPLSFNLIKKFGEIDALSTSTYETIYLNGRVWLAQNLDEDLPSDPDMEVPDFCFNDCNGSNRVYNWLAAREGCGIVGDGWRLPTEGEYAQMFTLFGGIESPYGQVILDSLSVGGKTRFNVGASGFRDFDAKDFAGLDNGFYWTGTENPDIAEEAILFEFDYGDTRQIFRTSLDKRDHLSVRCILDN